MMTCIWPITNWAWVGWRHANHTKCGYMSDEINDKNDDGTLANNWATGNPGFFMSRSSAKPDQYPTVPVEQGYDGACVKLTTSDTGQFGATAKMPIAAGNLFIGKFDAGQALKDAMKTTQFGPTLRGWPPIWPLIFTARSM